VLEHLSRLREGRAAGRMTLGIMQPYFLPYLGYWQLLAAVDRFVVYDNVKYTKKGWINRNRFLQNGGPEYFTVPIKGGSDAATIAERELAGDFDRDKLLRSLAAAYRKAPRFAAVFPVVEQIVQARAANLFEYLHHSLVTMAAFLEIDTPMVISSTIAIDHNLQAGNKVLALCRALGADRYLNPIGGQELYSGETFAAAGVTLNFLQSRPFEYSQFGGPFVPGLSILDVLMFNDQPAVRRLLKEADVVPAL
jgi:hypothetical protein